MTTQQSGVSVRHTITVEASKERAFQVFADQMGSWWPLSTKSIGSVRAKTAIVEPRAGGRWFERGSNGSQCDWGRVIAYEPPDRLVLNWQISADWRYDPNLSTIVEVRFIADGKARTRVELEHRGLEAYGDRAGQIEGIYGGPDGWTDILGHYAVAVADAAGGDG